MAVITLPARDNNDLQTAIAQIWQQSEARRMERERLAQQQAQFAQTFGLEEKRSAAQIAADEAAARAAAAQGDESRYKVASDRAGKVAAPILANFDKYVANGAYETGAKFIAGAASYYKDKDPEVFTILSGHLLQRDVLPSDTTAGNLAKYGSDVTGRVAAGGQNAIDVNLATKMLTGEQLTAPAFGNQDTREFGVEPLREAVAIADDRRPGATAQLQSATQLRIGREQNASAERIAQQRSAGEAGGVGQPLPNIANGATGADLLKSLPPAEAELVKAIADYRVDPAKAASQRSPKNGESERRRLITLALQYDPSYDMTIYPSVQAARRDFTSGKAAANIRSLNTAIKHIDEFDKAWRDLGNWRLPLINKAGNFVNRQLGDKAITNFNSAATAVADELATLFKGTAGTDSAIAHWRDSLDPNMSPEQFKGQVEMLLDLTGGRIAALEAQYRDTTKDPRAYSVVSSKSKEILDRLGAHHSGAAPTASASGGRMQKEQVNKATGERRIVYSDDGGATWHP